MNSPIYLDYAATTPVDPAVALAMSECLTLDGSFGNAASRSHFYGWKAEELVEAARSQLANCIGADPREIVWTSGATESNNLALKGTIDARAERPLHIITSQIEHKSVLDACGYLGEHGVEVSYVAPSVNGDVSLAAIAAELRANTCLISLMHANNETGVINDIAALGEFCRDKGILLHVDAAQTLGKIALNVAELNIDLMSMSAHKLYGPKGIGALYVRRHPDVRLSAQIHGGGHERGMRSGTLPTHQIVGFGKAAEVAATNIDEEKARIFSLREQFWRGIYELDGVHLNGGKALCLPGIVNVGFDGIDGETLLMSLRGLAISTGSACASATMEPSYVLTAMGNSSEYAHNSLRFSFGRFTQAEDIDTAVESIRHAHAALSPKLVQART